MAVRLRGFASLLVGIGFFFFLTALFYLSRDPPPSLITSQIGWQAFDAVGPSPGTGSGGKGTDLDKLPGGGGGDLWGGGTDGQGGDGEVYGNGGLAGAYGPASLPLDVYAPLLPNPAPLTAITVRPCVAFSWLSLLTCEPPSTPADDFLLGKWVRVGRPLRPNVRAGSAFSIYAPYLFYRRSRRSDVPNVVDLALIDESKTKEQEDKLAGGKDEWIRCEEDIRASHGFSALSSWLSSGSKSSSKGADGLRIYYRVRPGRSQSAPITAGIGGNYVQEPREGTVYGKAGESFDPSAPKAVTELDLVYGDGEPMWNFERMGKAIEEHEKGTGVERVEIVIRRTIKPVPQAPPLTFHNDGTFKIMQVADLHFSTGHGVCRNSDKKPCTADVDTMTLVERFLDEENPDLLVFTGDQINGQTTSWDSKSTIAKTMQIAIKKKLPWAAIFGNHDDETDLTREDEMRILQNMPYSLSEPGPKNVSGVGNYVLKIWSPDPSKTQLFTLYFLDSHAMVPRSKWSWKPPTDYDWIKPSQIKWFVEQSRANKPRVHPFTPDGASDLSKIWARKRRTAGTTEEEEDSSALDVRGGSETTFSKPNAMTFFHIPLPEAYDPPDYDSVSAKELIVGERHEGSGAPKKNSGFFNDGVLALGHERDTRVLVNGHCHISEDCRRIKGVWSCFGGGSSYAGYGEIGFDRRVRIFSLEDWGDKIRTWKRLESSISGAAGRVDDTVLYGKGALGGNG